MKIHAELSRAAIAEQVMPTLGLGLLDAAWAFMSSPPPI